MASHFESSELQLTPQLTPLYAFVIFFMSETGRDGRLKIKSKNHKFQVIGWGVSGAHDEYSKTVRPYVLFQNMDGAAAFPLDVLLSQNINTHPPIWDVNQSDAELIDDELGQYSLVQISKKRPSRKRRKRIEKIQRVLLSIEHENALAHEAEAAKLKKKKKK
jgi:hypothetical protein